MGYLKARTRKKSLNKKWKAATGHIMSFWPIRFFIRNRRAVNAVISNLILIAAVIVVGIIALAFARSNSSSYQAQYQQDVNSNIDKLKETLAYEYVHYNSGTQTLYAYFINPGPIDIEIDKVYVSSLSGNISFSMFYKSGQSSTGNTLEVGKEGYIISSSLSLSSGNYTVKLTTVRGSSFARDFFV